MEILTGSAKETKDLAKALALNYLDGGVIALSGDLGAGKTTFTQGFAEGLGIKEKIISPTFVLMRVHPLPDHKKTLFHIDLYRLEGGIDLDNLGISDLFKNPENIILIEWAEKAEGKLPENTVKINIEKGTSETQRKISIEN